jgi:leader peptidase (prepilin peptidase)/N-methyltransferase
MVGCLLAFFLGLVIGSFLNVCIHRIPKGESVVWPPSHCPRCGERIKWYDNLPLVSYFILKGRCRSCKGKISPLYPAVELLTGLITLALACKFGLSFDTLYYAIFSYYLIVVGLIDARTMEVPVKLSYFTLLAGLFLSFFTQSHSFKEAVFGASLGASIILFIIETYFVVTGKEGMGYGDANIMAVVGSFLGWKRALLTLFIGSVIGAIYGVLALKKRKEPFPFGPFLAVGALISLFFGEEIINWYVNLGGLK